MALKLLLVCFVCFKMGSSQYYTSSYPYPYNYPYPTSNYPATTYPVSQIPPTYPPSTYPVPTPTAYPTPAPQPSPYPLQNPQKGYYPSYGKNAPKTPTTTPVAYLVKTPENYLVNSSEKQKNTEKLTHKCSSYNCPLCDGFKNVVPNAKVPPPPKSFDKIHKSSPLLPELQDFREKISNIEKEVKYDKKSLLSKLKDVCEKPKLKSIGDKLKEKCEKVKCYRFDEDLLDGFLTGLGLGD